MFGWLLNWKICMGASTMDACVSGSERNRPHHATRQASSRRDIVGPVTTWESPTFCARDFCEGGFTFVCIENEVPTARSATFLGGAVFTRRSEPVSGTRFELRKHA